MLRSFRTIFPLLLFVVLGFFLWKGLHNDPHRIPSPFINKAIPEFSNSSLLQPQQVLTQAIFYGHVSLLNVFASWCGYCLGEHALLMDIARSHHVKMYGLNYKDKRSAVLPWLRRYGNPFSAIIFDPSGALAVDLGVYGTPETFLIDARGIIRYKYVGPITQTILRTQLIPQLEKLNHES